MKDYPSISRATGQAFEEMPNAYVFDKPDGSNVRCEISRKKGVTNYGTRTRTIDVNSGDVFPLFEGGSITAVKVIEKWAPLIDKVMGMLKDQRWDSIVLFAEFHGPNSFAGLHASNDTHVLEVFDINPYKKGILGPKEYLDIVKDYDLPAPRFHGRYNWTRGFVERVRSGEFECAFEGVVGKAGSGHHVTRSKAKTQRWIDKVVQLHSPDVAERLLNS